MKKIVALSAFFMLFLSVQSVKAWDGWTHKLIAHIAEPYLTDKAKEETVKYLGSPIYDHATWMDKVASWNKKRIRGWEQTSVWHMASVDRVGKKKYALSDKRTKKGSGALHDQLVKSIDVLKNRHNHTDSAVMINLKCLIHMVQDMHCPVHVGYSKKDYPEYRYSLRRNGKTYKTHGFWDGSPGFQRRGWTYEKYSSIVDNITPKQAKKIVKKGNLEYWGKDIIKQGHRAYAITPANTDIAKLTADEKANVLALADEMSMKAAYRLACVLNEIFK